MQDFMDEALKEAKKAYLKGEIPVGAVLVKDNKIILKDHNRVEEKNNVIMHAEMNVINKIIKIEKNWRLEQYDLYTTLEPCKMCMGAIENTRIGKIYYAAANDKVKKHKNIKQVINIEQTIKSKKMLKDFFKERR